MRRQSQAPTVAQLVGSSLWLLVLCLLLAGELYAAYTTPQGRAQAAAGLAHSMCTSTAPPPQCQPDRSPWSAISDLIRSAG